MKQKLTPSNDRQWKKDHWKKWKVIELPVYLLRLPTVKTCLDCCDPIIYKPNIFLQPPEPPNQLLKRDNVFTSKPTFCCAFFFDARKDLLPMSDDLDYIKDKSVKSGLQIH